ncbi:T9SS type A sorting domain-containing protein [Winogradskyella tangerina]|uniref:T9SS type A sorting domain-containing protein n=1 Tax=Winogradskyella tangerina TaxID=2023240 RepID=UPI000DBE48BD|nr:T9SS type A sorting domain-containing protein [Winogradskyella tangerina]
MKISQLLLILTIWLINNLSLFGQTQKGSIITGNGIYDGLDRSVAISNDANRIIVGATFSNVGDLQFSGAALVYQFNNNDWEFLGSPILGDEDFEFLGEAVEISPDGTRVAAGGDLGVRVYDLMNGEWEQIGDLITQTGISRIGNLEFSSDGQILAVGYTGDNVVRHVRVYEWINNQWTELGDGIDGSRFGEFSLNNSGDRIVVQESIGNLLFELKTYDFSGNAWSEVGSTISSIPGEVLTSGFSISADGTQLITTTRIDNTSSGYVTTYQFQGGIWVETIDELSITINNNFGAYLECSDNGTTFILGTSDDSSIGGTSDVFVYHLVGNQWELAGNMIDGSSSDESANGHVDITANGQGIIMAGNLTPVGNTERFAAVYDFSGELGLDEDARLNGINVYPNPTTGRINIAMDNKKSLVELSLHSLSGGILYKKTIANIHQYTFDVNEPSGMYILKIKSEQETQYIKILKQ